MGLLDPLLVGVFAARVANRLIDLGIDVNKIDEACRKVLYEIERDRRKDLSVHEAASYFFGAAFSNISPSSYLLPVSRAEMAFRAAAVVDGWVRSGKMRRQWAESIQKTLHGQL